MNQILDWLQTLGFSQYEAKVYLALLMQPGVTGYELAKIRVFLHRKFTAH